MARHTRYQGAIVRGDEILLIRHVEHGVNGRSYWLLPGGGIEDGETEEECVIREMWEETKLVVQVDRPWVGDRAEAGSVYQYRNTYLCRIVSGEASPGYEPEEDASSVYAIAEVGWFDLRQPETWPVEIIEDRITFPVVQRIRVALGY
jgi:8-oxo-dGTP diphosphatase